MDSDVMGSQRLHIVIGLFFGCVSDIVIEDDFRFHRRFLE